MTSRSAGVAVEALAFLCELVMLGVLVVAGIGIGDTTLTRILLAVVLPLVAATLWGIWMAPRSQRRLRDPGRLIAQIVLFIVTGTLAAVGGYPTLGIVFVCVAVGAFVLARVTRGGLTGQETSDA